MSKGYHSHPCQFTRFGCEHSIPCKDTNLMRNYDGWPEIICTFDALGISFEWVCEDCEDRIICEGCGAPDHLPHDEDCPSFEHESFDSEIPIEAYDDDLAYEYEVK